MTILFLTALASAAGEDRYLLLVGLDGFRADYLERFDVPNLRQFRQTGAAAAALEPAFPSTTFPNFYTMATGLIPERHGIVEMDFWDPRRRARFYYRDAKATDDGAWYGGTPLWASAEKAGLRSAMLFWPGSPAEIAGSRPWKWFSYDPAVTADQKVRQVLDWFSLPEPDRPRLAGVYFPDVDQAGHRHGPESAQTREAAARVDSHFGRLLAGLREVKPAVNVVVVSDHGMLPVSGHIDLRAPSGGCQVTNGLMLVQVHCPDAQDLRRLRETLGQGGPNHKVYGRRQVPPRLAYSANPRIGDLVIFPSPGYLIELQPPGAASQLPDLKGMHGYDPALPEMHGILLAAGPVFRPGVRLPTVRTVDVYALAAAVLGLPVVPGLDAEPGAVKGMLR